MFPWLNMTGVTVTQNFKVVKIQKIEAPFIYLFFLHRISLKHTIFCSTMIALLIGYL